MGLLQFIEPHETHETHETHQTHQTYQTHHVTDLQNKCAYQILPVALKL